MDVEDELVAGVHVVVDGCDPVFFVAVGWLAGNVSASSLPSTAWFAVGGGGGIDSRAGSSCAGG